MARHTIVASEQPVLDVFCDKYLFRIPSYQRPYAWTTEEAGALLDDIETACPDAGDIDEASPYFLGSIVVIKDAQRPEADIVDGQQRLTTLTIILAVLRDLADARVGPAIHKYVCQAGDPIEGTSDRFRLALRERDAGFFRDTIQAAGSTSALPDVRQFRDALARLVGNTAHLRTRLAEQPEARRQRLTTFIVKRCYLVVVAASDQQSAFRIFSVLNSRGLDLTAPDILKADIIGALPADRQDEYTKTWEDLEEELGRDRFAELFGHIRMIHRKQKMERELIVEFRELVPAIRNPIHFIRDELVPYADAFGDIVNRAFGGFAQAERINRHLVHLGRLDNLDWQPPAIEMVARHRGDPDLMLAFLRDLERLAYALFLLRSAPSDRIRRYGRLLAAMQAGADLFMANSPLQLDEAEKQAVRDALAGDLYTVTRVRLPLLLRLDELLSGGSATYDHPLVTVEHVLPQSPADGSYWLSSFPDAEEREEWVHKLANLVLLTRRKNAQAGNLDFAEKKAKYFSTRAGIANFALTSKVLSESEWTRTTLARRQSELMNAIAELWRLG